jgi:D-alanyl-D-alanine carboxypeptidase (penicillin-binding protein 5/6)
VVALLAVLLAAPPPGRAAPGPGAAQPLAAVRRGPVVVSRFAILVDPASGEVLWQRNPTVPRPPASLTKMLTAVTVRASLPMQRRLIVSPSADRTPANALRLGAGHDITVAQALTALMMISANDIAVVLAAHAAGSVPRFATAMDAQSRRLGLTSSTWHNPNGLDEHGNRSSASDLAILARAVLRDPWLARTARRRETVAFTTPDGQRRSLWNKGQFLRRYPGAVGVKTGFTDDAGRCLAGAATRGGRTLVAVVLGTPDPPKDAAALMDWGFGPGRDARTGLRLPAWVEPASVTELLEPKPPVVATPAPAPVQAATHAHAPASPTEPLALAAGAVGACAATTGLVLLTMRLRRTRRRLLVLLDDTGPATPDHPD